MIIKKVAASGGALSFKFISTAIVLYFFVVFPGVHFFLRDHPWLPQYGYAIYFAGVLAYGLKVKKVSLEQLGFSRKCLGNHLWVGIVLGSLIVLALPFLDTLISLSGLGQNELFSDAANQRKADDWKSINPIALAAKILIIPLLTQVFFTGLIHTGLSRKYHPQPAIYASIGLFTLGHFKLTLGLVLLGGISTFLFRLTGTIYASILFHIGCSLAGILLLYIYPRLSTLLIFLF